MKKRRFCAVWMVISLAIGMHLPARAESPQSAASTDIESWGMALADHHTVYPDQVYGYFGGAQLKLDVWQVQSKTPKPIVVYIHGGGWLFGDRTGADTFLFPWITRGWNVVNVEYRMTGTALAPAAVEDARCALRWVYRNASKFNFDTRYIVVTGHSAGGHLALTTGMLTPEDGFDDNCPADPQLADPPMKVAAIVNWYGISDIVDLLQGQNMRPWAVSWIGGRTDKKELARRVSPLTYVHSGQPPVITVHGDQDPVVPYSNATRLHQALQAAHVPNELVTIPGGKHGYFGEHEDINAYRRIFAFLEANVPGLKAAEAKP